MTHALNRRAMLSAAAVLAVPALLTGHRAATAQSQVTSVIDTLAGEPRFNTLVNMAGRAGFTDQLRGPGPITVFAPTDEAFRLTGANIVADLLEQGSGGSTLGGSSPDLVRLRALLQYHAVRGAYRAIDLTPNMMLRTLNGNELQVVAGTGGQLALRNPAPGQQFAGMAAGGINILAPAQVVQADIPASNGIIHAIGGVLFP